MIITILEVLGWLVAGILIALLAFYLLPEWLYWSLFAGANLFYYIGDTVWWHRSLFVRGLDAAWFAYCLYNLWKSEPPKWKKKVTKLIGDKSRAIIEALSRRQAEDGA